MQPCQGCPHFVSAICEGPRTGHERARSCGAQVEAPPGDDQIDALFERHQRHVVAWACRFTSNYELANDIGQDVFVEALTAIGSFRGDASVDFSTWLYTITRQCSRDSMKACIARPREVDDRAGLAAPPIVDNEAIASLEAQHATMLGRRLMRVAGLDAIEARAFMMHFRDEIPLDTVTARLGLTNPSGARALITSAKRKLRRRAARWRHFERRDVIRGHAT